ALNEQQNTPQPEQQDAKQQQAQQQPDATQQPEDKEQPKQSDARAIDAINQENINRLNRQRKAFNAPAAHNKDW
ncbi:MAG: hypothetical protein J6X55_13610, partial [Victivallales bacterium]|nr:hypothetical protein [Victivallales bacterium]